jgi:hypothetical protein
MIKKAYTTEIKVEEFLGISIDAGKADDAINQAIDLVDKITGRNFVADTVASARAFDGLVGHDLFIDDCIQITKVEVGGDYYGDTKVENTRYVLLPANYSAKGLPITRVHLKDSHWPTGLQNHSITAKWGYSSVCPDGISFATAVLAGGIYMFNKGGASGDTQSESIGNYSVSYATEQGWKAYQRALQVLEGYKKRAL